MFGFSSNPTFGAVIILVAFPCILVSFFLLIRQTSATPDQFEDLVGQQVTAPTWEREVPKMPIEDQKTLDDLQLAIRQLRTTAIQLFNEARTKGERSAVDSAKIRTNVFLVRTKEVQEFGTLGMVIPEQMQDNMDDFGDRNIKLLPHEGITGRTFTLGQPSGAKATFAPPGKLNWEKVDLFPNRPSSDKWKEFVLSEEQQELIGTKLRWIVSFPLSYDRTDPDTTFGVLNIDCIGDPAEDEDMQTLASGIEPNVLAFAARVAELPKVRITIRVEDTTE